ncbi:MAG: hypothetical protein AMXMBFR57_16410 [Acidimicrobiia bacterium]|jgi:hypothetical protein
MVYLMPAAPQASSSSCSANELWTVGGTTYYSANCGPGSCPYEAYDLAIDTCGGDTMVEFFCDDGSGMVTWGCYGFILD